MTISENKLLDSIRAILENIDINGFKAEFNLETKQVRIELLAEYDDMDETITKIKNQYKSNDTTTENEDKSFNLSKESIVDRIHEGGTDETNHDDNLGSEFNNEHSPNSSLSEPEKKYPSKIS